MPVTLEKEVGMEAIFRNKDIKKLFEQVLASRYTDKAIEFELHIKYDESEEGKSSSKRISRDDPRILDMMQRIDRRVEQMKESNYSKVKAKEEFVEKREEIVNKYF